MSAHPDLHRVESDHEASGEQLFAVIALAFGVLLVTIIAGFFMPVGIAVGVNFAILAVVIALIGGYLFRLLGDD
jgi:hypothetical protein